MKNVGWILGILLFVGTVVSAAGTGETYKLWYRQPAKDWYEALPLGNGCMGVMVAGGVRCERLQLSEETLWSGQPAPKILPPDIRERREQIMQHLFAGELEVAAREMNALDKMKYDGKDGIVIEGVTQREHRYETMGNLWLFNDHELSPEKDYYRDLDLERAVATVKYRIGEAGYVREAFCSYPRKIAVVRITADKPGRVSFRARMDRPVEMKETWSDLLTADKLLPPEPVNIEKVSDSEIAMSGHTAAGGMGFRTHVRVVARGGKVAVDQEAIRCIGADEVMILIGSLTDYYDYPDMAVEIDRRFDEAEKMGYTALKEEHVADHAALYGRFSVRLDQTACSKLPTDMRIRRLKHGILDPRVRHNGDFDPEFAALFWQYCRYLMIATCREGTLPASLQYWNNSLTPDWYGRFTTNVNLQENFWGVETTNLSSLHHSLFDMVLSFLPAAGEVARKSYGCRGAVLPGRGISIYGPEYIYDSWNDGGAWIGQHFWEHFLFTCDTVFLREKAYPYMKQMALFYLDYLREDPDGYLVTGPSHSPENSFLYRGKTVGIDYGITMSRAIIHEILTNTASAATVLGQDEAFGEELMAACRRLIPYRIGRYGIQEWRQDYEEKIPGHRHISHLYGLYPGSEITSQQPELYEAARRSFTRRLENGGYWNGWSCAWGVGLAARLHDGASAYRLVDRLMKDAVFDNLLTTHNRGGNTYDVFSMDGNLGFIGAMSEIFIQSHTGFVELLPALPACWKSGRIEGICARGGFEVAMEWKDGKLLSTSIHSHKGGLLRVKYGDRSVEIPTLAGESYRLGPDLRVVDRKDG